MRIVFLMKYLHLITQSCICFSLNNPRIPFVFPLQLSSKCDNRLFRIRFYTPKMGRYPFFETLSFPIRCVSRSRNSRTTSTPWRKASSGIYLLNGSQSHDDGPVELLPSIVREAKPSPSSKRIKLGQDKTFATFENNLPLKQAGKGCNSHVLITDEVSIVPFIFSVTRTSSI